MLKLARLSDWQIVHVAGTEGDRKMRLRTTSKKVIAGCALTLALGIVAGVTSSCGADAQTGNEPGQGAETTEQRFWNVATVEETSALAGYPAAEVKFVPDGFVRAANIAVIKHPTEKQVFTVTQTWRLASDKAIEFNLVQNPELDGIGDGQPIDLNGMTGEVAFTPAFEDRPELISFYWRDGEMAFVLTGTVGDALSEATLRQIAASITMDAAN
jgi:hypothetical protein